MTTASVDTTIRLIAAGELAGETCTPELAEAPWAFDAAPPSYGPGASMADPIPPQTPRQGELPEEYRSASGRAFAALASWNESPTKSAYCTTSSRW
jgi:quinolinate synthase